MRPPVLTRRVPIAAAAIMAVGLMAGTAAADEWRGWHGDIHHFSERDWGHWRGGYWRHIWHDGRLGWWWVVGPYWYFYPSPVYPYPDPYVPPAMVMNQSAAPAPQGPPPTQSWYYCDNPQGYYPYVQNCTTQWRSVPAMPPGQAPTK